jgi:hypothetical protein
MSVVGMSGSDSATINGLVMSGQSDGDWGVLSFPSELMSVKTGKNGNSLYSFNNSGMQAEFRYKCIRGSADDKFLNGQLSQMKANPAGFPLMFAKFVKQIGDGQGNILKDTYLLSGGVIMKTPEAKANAEGDASQSIVEWSFRFANNDRVLT